MKQNFMLSSSVTVHANDKDEVKNAELRYSLDGSLTDFFSVDPFSGWLTNLVSLDRERQSSYTLNLLAVDGGNPSLNATAKIHVNLVDCNDNPSIFTQPSYVASGTAQNLEKLTCFMSFLSPPPHPFSR